MTTWAERIVAPPPVRPIEPGPVPTFSVIIAAYQSAGFIAEAIESAFEQTIPAHEIIVSDDGSTDDLEGALEPYRDRITVLRNPHAGEGATKNAALGIASGDFVAFLDSDDAWRPERLEALGALAAARPDLDILETDAFMEADGQVVARMYRDCARFITDDQRAGILRSNFLVPHPAVRRERLLFVGGFDASMLKVADWDCWLRLILDGACAGLIDEPLLSYRLRVGSISADLVELTRWSITALERADEKRSLTSRERGIQASSVKKHRRTMALLEAQRALVEGSPIARRRLLRIALGRGTGTRIRLRALAAVVSPGRAARYLRERASERPYLPRCPDAPGSR